MMTKKEFLEIEKEHGFEYALSEALDENEYLYENICNEDTLLNYVKHLVDKGFYWGATDILNVLAESPTDNYVYDFIMYDPIPITCFEDIEQYFEK